MMTKARMESKTKVDEKICKDISNTNYVSLSAFMSYISFYHILYKLYYRVSLFKTVEICLMQKL